MSSSGRRALVMALAALLLLASAGLAVRHVRAQRCGAHVHPDVPVASPLLGARQRARRPDARRDRLVRAVQAWPAPFGPVLGAIGYDYDEYLHVAGVPDGLAVWTRDDPTMQMLSARTLRPRWAVRTDTARSAWDVGADRFLDIALARGRAPQLSALALDDGHALWCARLGLRPVHPDDPLSTQVLPGGDVLALTPGPPGQVVLSRLAAADGRLRWRRSVRSGGDFVGDLGGGTVVAGGAAAWRLADDRWLARQPDRVGLAGVSLRTGRLRWTLPSPAGSAVHVVGADPVQGLVVVMSWGRHGGRLFALSRAGDLVWSAEPFRHFHLDATLRSGRVLVRADGRLAGYTASTGHRLWLRHLPARRQFLPYGFELDSVPSLDDAHVLLPTTTAVRRLDLDTGAMASYPLPRDGIRTTFWPYQLAATDRLLAVVTNTGAVVARRVVR
ncbi:MAG TPA: PQQ-binding-like beta-propeller repeat protein [Marmoricola sp.]